MTMRREGWILLLTFIAIFVLVSILALFTSYVEPLYFIVRLCALYGFAALAIATIMTPFLKEITQAFGKSFLKIHHFFAIFGIIFVTLHPIFLHYIRWILPCLFHDLIAGRSFGS
ncbi:MAG: hypothetical protein ACFFD8_08805 [Candidatus Thorarchaeota archaeon]